MSTPLIPVVWGHFIFNLLLQILDGVLTYQVLSLGVLEWNPLVNAAIAQWGAVWGLLYWKTLACISLLLIFAVRQRQQILTINALTLTATVYGCVAVAAFGELLLQLRFI